MSSGSSQLDAYALPIFGGGDVQGWDLRVDEAPPASRPVP